MSVLPHHLPSVPVEEAIVVEPPSLPTFGSGSAELGTPSDSSVTPEVSKQASSQNVAPGHLAHRVTPTYPQQALLLRLQGKVILEATVYEDGTVHDLSVLQGQSVLAQAAVAAVERWRYKPYQLNGKPVKRKTTIAVDFKLPENTSSR
jgi:TonB family protein